MDRRFVMPSRGDDGADRGVVMPNRGDGGADRRVVLPNRRRTRRPVDVYRLSATTLCRAAHVSVRAADPIRHSGGVSGPYAAVPGRSANRSGRNAAAVARGVDM